MAGRENQGDQRGRKQHFDNRNISIIAAEYTRERVRVIDAEAFGGAWKQEQMREYVSLCTPDEEGSARQLGRVIYQQQGSYGLG